MTRIDRLLAYLLMFQSRGLIRAQDFAERFEISERTVYRDIDALCEVGVPIYGVAGEGYRLMEGYYLRPVTFTPEEARALALALSMFTGFAVDGETRQAAGRAREKIQAILPNRQKGEVAALTAVLNFYALPQPQIDFDDQKLLAIQRAIHHNQLIDLTYYSQAGKQQTRRVVEPIELTMMNHTWLLNGYCRLRQDIRNFNLARIEQYHVLTQSFVPRKANRPRFPEEEFDLVVRFDLDAVRWVRERQHTSFVNERESTDRGVIMIYRVPAWGVISPWLLGWGDQMTILEPPHLREHVRQMGQRMAEKHAG